MEPNFFKELPKFQSPEEELKFLREHIAKREQELVESGAKPEIQNIAKETLDVYKNIPQEQVLSDKNKVSESEAGQFVLRLKPEAHDSKMEELLGILISRGIKAAMEMASGFKNPHIDDDFHRFLVQYLVSAQNIPGLKEGTPVFKGLNMSLFEITLPPSTTGNEKGFKELLGAMEQFYAGMQSVAGDVNNKTKEYYTLEISLSSSSNEVVIYAAVPKNKGQLFEKQVLAFYTDAKVREVSDDYNIFSVGGASSGAYASLSENPIMPIKTHDALEHDPMQAILNVFSKMKREGEGAAIQFTIIPAGDTFIKRFTSILKDVKDGLSVKEANEKYKVGQALISASKNLLFGSGKEKDKEKKIDDNAISNISEKIKSSILEVSVRFIASAETKNRADDILTELESAFNQFNDPGSNRFVFNKIPEKKLPELFHEYSYRLINESENLPLNLRELSTIFHFPVGVGNPQLKEAKAGIAPAPLEMSRDGILLGINKYRGMETPVHMKREDRMRHFYVIGQTGTGKTVILKNMIAQDIANGDGCCFIDPHGTDIQDILSYVPPERIDDVIYFDPAYIPRPMALNMLEFDPRYPEQKTMVIDTLMMIFNQLFSKESMGPMFEQYFKNGAYLVMDHPESGSTLLEITRVLADKAFRDMKLEHCKNPIVKQFWASAEATTGDQGLANFVPYITSKFDVFISNEFTRPVVLQETSALNFRDIMDNKKILLVNLSKGRLGELNANLIGMLIVMKFQMAALSRVDSYGKQMSDFYLYIDEFQNVTTPAIASILSEARKYRLSLNVAHQYISQLPDDIKNAVFGNVGSMAVFRISPEDASFLEPKFSPTFTAQDISRLDNYNAYMSMIINGAPALKPFNIETLAPRKGNVEIVEKLKQISYLKYGRDRVEVEEEVFAKFKKAQQ